MISEGILTRAGKLMCNIEYDSAEAQKKLAMKQADQPDVTFSMLRMFSDKIVVKWHCEFAGFNA